jgi:hypothetical protein
MPARTAQEGAGAVRGHYDHSATWSGVILSGSTALELLVAAMAKAPADAPAGLAAFNAGFEHRTGYEWLSRDAA